MLTLTVTKGDKQIGIVQAEGDFGTLIDVITGEVGILRKPDIRRHLMVTVEDANGKLRLETYQDNCGENIISPTNSVELQDPIEPYTPLNIGYTLRLERT